MIPLQSSNGFSSWSKAVVIEDAQVNVQIRANSLLDKPDESTSAASQNDYVVHRIVPARLKRCGMAMRLKSCSQTRCCHRYR